MLECYCMKILFEDLSENARILFKTTSFVDQQTRLNLCYLQPGKPPEPVVSTPKIPQPTSSPFCHAMLCLQHEHCVAERGQNWTEHLTILTMSWFSSPLVVVATDSSHYPDKNLLVTCQAFLYLLTYSMISVSLRQVQDQALLRLVRISLATQQSHSLSLQQYYVCDPLLQLAPVQPLIALQL